MVISEEDRALYAEKFEFVTKNDYRLRKEAQFYFARLHLLFIKHPLLRERAAVLLRRMKVTNPTFEDLNPEEQNLLQDIRTDWHHSYKKYGRRPGFVKKKR